MKKNYNLIAGLILVLLFGGGAVFGQNTSFLDFDGDDDYVKYVDDATLGLMDGATDYTIEAWIFPASGRVAEYDRVLQRYYSFAFVMYDGNDDGNVEDWYFQIYDKSSSSWKYYNTQGDATLTLDAWNQIAIINNSSDGSLKLFVNGVDVSTTGGYTNRNMPSSSSNDNLYIGQKGNGASYFGGYIDEVRLKKSAEDIGDLNTSKYGNQYTSDANTAILFEMNGAEGYYAVNAVNQVKANLGSSTEGDSGEPTWRSWSYEASHHLPLAHEWICAVSQEWSNSGNWGGGMPTSSSDVIIPTGSTQFPDIGNSVSANCNNITIESGMTLYVEDGGVLTVSGSMDDSGTLAISGDVTIDGDLITDGGFDKVLIYASNTYKGSLIHNNAGVGASIHYEIIGYDEASGDGWHLISMPVDNPNISAPWTPTSGQDDLYYWDESAGDAGMWKNYFSDGGAGGQFTSFTNGQGYLCSYKTSQNKTIGGLININDVLFSNMSVEHNHWHLLGNPFACALDWNVGSWNISNVSIPQVYDEAKGDYFPVDGDYGNIIPSGQGFFVQAAGAANAITIPADARVHNDKLWYKNDQAYENTLCLKLSGGNDSYSSQTTIVMDPTATMGYDVEYDSHKILGASPAPKIFTTMGEENFATNHIPSSANEILIPVKIRVFSDGEYTIDTRVNTIVSENNTYLEDLQTGELINLSTTDSYTFQASTQDAENRFVLHFNSTTAVNEMESSRVNIYANHHAIYINAPEAVTGDIMIYDMGGKLVLSQAIENSNMQSISAQNLSGVYLVHFIEANQVSTQKVIIQ
jgi:hypothetical protein